MPAALNGETAFEKVVSFQTAMFIPRIWSVTAREVLGAVTVIAATEVTETAEAVPELPM